MISTGLDSYLKSLGYKSLSELDFDESVISNCRNIQNYGGINLWRYIVNKYGSNIPLQVYQDFYAFKNALELVFLEQEYKYKKLLETTQLDYDLLKPYHIEEEIVTGNKMSSETTSPSGSISNDTSETSFDSLEAKLKESVTTTFNNQTSHSYTNNVSEIYKDEVFDGLSSSEKSKSTREGNIGNHVVADIIEKERNISNFSLWEVIAKDVIRYTCFSIHTF